MTVWYNEPDPGKAAWLRELIKAKVIAPGDVDERSIEDVKASELMGYTQCHFFAGIGVWSYALRQAGWPDGRPVWTGSCPCPSFSVAGKGKGFDDPRHLWPAWHRLIRECRPGTVFGEQADGAIGHGWLDPLTARSVAEAGATRGFWADCDWWYGRDEKYRPIGPGLFPLASGVTARVLQLRGFGDSIVAPCAIEFIKAYLEARKI